MTKRMSKWSDVVEAAMREDRTGAMADRLHDLMREAIAEVSSKANSLTWDLRTTVEANGLCDSDGMSRNDMERLIGKHILKRVTALAKEMFGEQVTHEPIRR